MKSSLLKRTVCALLPVAALLFADPATALTVSPIFRSNMVLQRNTTVPVWGTDTAGTVVTVQFLNQSVSATADAAGTWRVNLASMAANAGANAMIVSSATGSATFTAVQVGEVWLCSGQSNMGKPLSYADNSAPYISDAPNHDIRLFRMIAGNGPSTSSWTLSDSTSASNFSAVGYWFGLDLSEDLNVPIGLIQATHDGTSIDHWEHTDGGTGDDYDAMVKAIQPFAIKGVLWYQGESNGGDSAYQAKLTDMLGEWRSDWTLSALPFGIIQLPSTKWTTAELAQYNVVQTVANTFLVVIHDLPGSSQLHPTAKYLVGMRSSIGARGFVYGEPIEYAGPVPSTRSTSGSTVTVTYTHAGNGLFTSNGAAPGPFTVAPSSGRASSGTGTISSANTITVTSSVSVPATIQYGISSAGNVFNHVNIPTEGGKQSVDRLCGSLYSVPSR